MAVGIPKRDLENGTGVSDLQIRREGTSWGYHLAAALQVFLALSLTESSAP